MTVHDSCSALYIIAKRSSSLILVNSVSSDISCPIAVLSKLESDSSSDEGYSGLESSVFSEESSSISYDFLENLRSLR